MKCNIPNVGMLHCRHGPQVSTRHTNRLFQCILPGRLPFGCRNISRVSHTGHSGRPSVPQAVRCPPFRVVRGQCLAFFMRLVLIYRPPTTTDMHTPRNTILPLPVPSPGGEG